MQVLRSRHFFGCVLTVMGVAIFSAGCRSTRDSLSTLPGMGWVGPRDEASFREMASDDDKPMLPPPSREATPQVVSSEPASKASPSVGAYPDTGFTSPVAPRNASSGNMQNYASGTENALRGFDRTPSATDAAGVGATQRGFYGDQYQGGDRSSAVAGGAAEYEPPAGRYDSTRDDARNSASGPTTNQWGGPSPSSGLSAAESAGSPPSSSPYQQIRDGLRDDWRNTTSTVSRSAEEMTQQAQDFVQGSSEELQQGVDSIRDGIRDQYQEFSQGVAGQVDQGGQDAADAVSAWDSSSPTNPAVPSGTNSEGAYPTTSEPSTPGYDTAATLNPPSTERSGPSTFDGYSTEPAGARSNEPWRPGSTSDYPQSPSATPNGASSGMGPRPYVEPASYDSWGTDSEPAPTQGWSSQSQRLSPTYR